MIFYGFTQEPIDGFWPDRSAAKAKNNVANFAQCTIRQKSTPSIAFSRMKSKVQCFIYVPGPLVACFEKKSWDLMFCKRSKP